MNTTTMTKMHHKLVAVTEERDRLAAELAKLREQKHSYGNSHPYYAYIAGIIRKVNEEGCAAPVAAPAVPVGDGWFYRDGEEAIRISAPSVPEEWREKLLAGFPLLDEEGLCQEKHHCEWTLLQDRKRLHAMLQSAAQQATPSVPEEWKRAVSDFLESHDAAWHELFKSLPADTRSVTVSNYQADAVRKANVLRALLQSAEVRHD